MKIRTILTAEAPAAIGPYSQAVVAGPFVFCSGQIALAPGETKITGSAGAQTRQILKNLKAVLEAAGSSLEQVVKTTVYLTDIADFPEVNAVYAELFGDSRPARATVEVASLPKEAVVEIDAVAILAG